MKFTNSSNIILTIFLEGRIDSSNSAAIDNEISKILEDNPHEKAIFDAEKLEYISSAGLRVILKVRKSEPELKIINASLEVYEIFSMTGFTEMMTVEKAYRMLSVEGCEVIGQGANGKVYRLDGDTIVKVYMNPESLEDIHHERELARKAFVLGLPTAISYDVAKVGDSYGSVFELLNAKSFAKLIAAEPENLEKYVEIYAKLLKQIHSNILEKGELPDRKASTLKKIRNMKGMIPDEQYEKLCRLVEEIPEKCNMIHGDYHIKNVLMQNNEPTLIDMDTLSMGHPIFEFAAMYLAYIGYGEADHSNIADFLGVPFEFAVRIWRKTLEVYFDTDDKSEIEEIEEKSALVGYACMLERIKRRHFDEDEYGRATAEICTRRIAELLAKTDTLDF